MAGSDLKDKIYAKIKWLRTQPESVKTRYVWGLTLVVFAVVALLWVGLFRKYEKKSADNGKNSELTEAVKKIGNEIGDKIKVPDIKLPEKLTPTPTPTVSPETSPEI